MVKGTDKKKMSNNSSFSEFRPPRFELGLNPPHGLVLPLTLRPVLFQKSLNAPGAGLDSFAGEFFKRYGNFFGYRN